MKIVIFCGGRGSQHIVREALRHRDIEISLIVNAYDDGLSTGKLRQIIPGMLGPSDFRKNLSYLLKMYSPRQLSLLQLIEYRLSKAEDIVDLSVLERIVNNDISLQNNGIVTMLKNIEDKKRKAIINYIKTFFEYCNKEKLSFDLDDFSIGNIIFSGIYLQYNENFNEAAKIFAELVDAEGNLINVSVGEDRILVGLKEDGEVLYTEASIVGLQSNSEIKDLFFLTSTSIKEAKKLLDNRSIADKQAFLKKLTSPPIISKSGQFAIENADIIVYGPGTQHSSLFPSYIIAAEAIKNSSAKKIMICNLKYDHDIMGYSVEKLAQRALFYLNDPENDRRVITHILVDNSVKNESDRLYLTKGQSNKLNTDLYGAILIQGEYVNPSNNNYHSGNAVINSIIKLAQKSEGNINNDAVIEIFIDLYKRSILLEMIIQEISEIKWKDFAGKIIITFNNVSQPKIIHISPFIEIRYSNILGIEPHYSFVSTWVQELRSDFLMCVTGDGEYRMSDLCELISISEKLRVGAVFGSRSQSRKGLYKSLLNAYGDRKLVSRMSTFGAYIISFLFFIRFSIIISDPLTGMVAYRREGLKDKNLFKSSNIENSGSAIIKQLLNNRVEICEIPVNYRTYAEFTDVKWRIKRGIFNIIGFFK